MDIRVQVQQDPVTQYTSPFNYAQIFLDVELKLSFGSLDRAQCIANAFQDVWPDIKLLNCYPHLVRKSREKTKLLSNASFYEDNILPDLRYLSKARSQKQFNSLSELFVKYWRDEGETEYAEWFQSYYLGEIWGNWYYAAAKPGITPSQNALEAHHRVIKEACVLNLRASTAVVLNDSIPRILRHQEIQPTVHIIRHFGEGPLVSEVVVKAQTLLSDKGNYYLIKDVRTRCAKAILFNASKFVVSARNIHSTPLNRDRATKYRNSLKGKLPKKTTVLNAELQCLSIHQVILLKPDSISGMCATPTVLDAQIIAIREKYACDCAMFSHTGWQCSHVIAAMTLIGDITIDSMLNSLPTRKLSGGQRKQPKALTRGGDNIHRFSVDVLIKDFLKLPAKPLHWNILRGFKLHDSDGSEQEQFLLRKVLAWGDKEGIYFWVVKLSNDEQLKLECQELAECTNLAYTHGVDIAGVVTY